ncbi:MAG: hypothetical protein AABY15_07790 [Nanoarchaeota archaeon]
MKKLTTTLSLSLLLISCASENPYEIEQVSEISLAQHSWNNFHWADTNLNPTVLDKTTSNLWKINTVENATNEWTSLGTPLKPTMLLSISKSSKGDITVNEQFSVDWLGLARVFIDENGHITKGEVKLNTTFLEGYGNVVSDHVLCQELGHILGLDHNRNQFDTCMNDCALMQTKEEWLNCLNYLNSDKPNLHDTEQLNLIYNHTDTVNSGTCRGKKCVSGKWVIVHEFPVL